MLKRVYGTILLIMHELSRNPAKSMPSRVSIPPITSELRDVLAATHTLPDGRPLNMFLTLAHHPQLLKRVNLLAGAFHRGKLAAGDRETVVLRVAATCGTSYVFDKHAAIAVRCGLTQADVDILRSGATPSQWTGRQRALLDFTDSVLDQDAVKDSVWSKVSFHESPDAMIELTTLIGFYRMMCCFANVMRLEVEEP